MKKKIIKVVTCIISIITILSSIILNTFADGIHESEYESVTESMTIQSKDLFLANAEIGVRYSVDGETYDLVRTFENSTTLRNGDTILSSVQWALMNRGSQGYNELIQDVYKAENTGWVDQVNGIQHYTHLQWGTPITKMVEDMFETPITVEEIAIETGEFIFTDIMATGGVWFAYDIIIPNGITSSTAMSNVLTSTNAIMNYERIKGTQYEERGQYYTRWTIENVKEPMTVQYTWDSSTRTMKCILKDVSRPNNVIIVDAIGDVLEEYKLDIGTKCNIGIHIDTSSWVQGMKTTGIFEDAYGDEYLNIGQNLNPVLHSFNMSGESYSYLERQYEVAKTNEQFYGSVTVIEAVAPEGFTEWIKKAIEPIMSFEIAYDIKIGDIVTVMVIVSIFIIILKVFAGG